jgi:3-methyladenine DNA glycosylase AlkD
MSTIIQQIRKDLKENIDPKTQKSFQRFFKEKVKCYGVKTAIVGKIAKKHWKEVSALDKKTIFSLCEELYQSDYTEDAFIVSFWLPNLADKFEKKDLATFKKWISTYINNWAKCDGFCNHTIGSFIEKYPDSIKEIKSWAKSKNRWLKRASAVSFIVPAKEGRFLKDAFEIADMLLKDTDDMVQKGYGWLLKEESREHQKEVFDYVVRNKKVMPRTALRYAIELMPGELKAKAMKRD